jgi:hypothetical protein
MHVAGTWAKGVESSKILSVLNIEPAKGLFLDLPAERE